MPLRFKYAYVARQFAEAMRADYGRIEKAATLAVRDTGKAAQEAGRLSIAGAGGRFGRGWQNALSLRVYPKSGYSAGAAALIYHKIRYAGVFETGATIAGKPYMFVPLRNSPSTIAGKKLTPAIFRERVGPLFYLKRPGRNPLLTARIATTTPKGRRVSNINLAALRRGASGSGKTRSVPIFVGIPLARIGKRFHVAGAVELAARQLPDRYSKYFQQG